LDYDRWLGPAAFTPYTLNRCSADATLKTWWFNSDYALGFISGWGIHPMDIALWGAPDLIGGSVTVEGRGNFRLAEGACDTATIWDVDYTFGSGLTVKFVGVPNGENSGKPTGEPFLNHDAWAQRYLRIEDHGTAFEGTDGWVHVDRTGINLQPVDLAHLDPEGFKEKLVRSSSHAGNFIACVKSRSEAISPVDTAVTDDALCHIADIALRLNRKLTFDFRTERFLNDDAANQRLRARAMRKPWHL